MLSVENLYAGYKNTIVLNNISFSLGYNESCSIVGPSGCGKTTLLMSIAGILRPIKGKIELKKELNLSFVFQRGALMPWKTVFENVILGLKIGKKAVDADHVISILSDLSIANYRDRYPHELSGGQRQRVALARALVSPTELILLDEPFSSLDFVTRNELKYLVLSLQNKYSFSMVVVTHNLDDAAYLGQQVFILGKKPAEFLAVVKANEKMCSDFDNNPEFYRLCSDIMDLATEAKKEYARE